MSLEEGLTNDEACVLINEYVASLALRLIRDNFATRCKARRTGTPEAWAADLRGSSRALMPFQKSLSCWYCLVRIDALAGETRKAV